MASDLSAQVRLHAFADPVALAQALAATVADDLRAAIAARGIASLALSGGNTPKRFMQALSQQPLSWGNVVVTLVDERWVPESDDRSNARLLRQNLLQGAAAAARFLPLHRETPQPEDAIGGLERDLAALPLPFDALVLGMGNDGHTASFFPGGDRLDNALDPVATTLVSPMRAPGAAEPRVTLTLAPIVAARHPYLHIEGAEKQRVFEDAVAGTGAGAGYPMRAVLGHASAQVQVFYCP